VVQSTPTASQPIAAILGSQAPPPFVNTIDGTIRSSALRVSCETICAM
jgi:hypothetical protein